MSVPPDNHSRTPGNPVGEVTPEVLRCLSDWLRGFEPTDQKSHRILRALVDESLKKAAFRQDQRRFTAKELAEAAQANTVKSASDWLSWRDVQNYFGTRKENGLVDLAVERGLGVCPALRRNSTQGGPGNETTYEIVADPLPIPTDGPDRVRGNPGRGDGILYARSAPGEIKLAWWTGLLFRGGEFQLRGWRRWLVMLWILGHLVGAMVLVLILFLGLNAPKPLTTQTLATLVVMVGIPLALWHGLLVPFSRLSDDRIKMASDFHLALAEEPAQLEIFREGDRRVLRYVRYTSSCPFCGAGVQLGDGAPDFPRRLVGRCSESPREHVFSFDRVTGRGHTLRGPDREHGIG